MRAGIIDKNQFVILDEIELESIKILIVLLVNWMNEFFCCMKYIFFYYLNNCLGGTANGKVLKNIKWLYYPNNNPIFVALNVYFYTCIPKT